MSQATWMPTPARRSSPSPSGLRPALRTPLTTTACSNAPIAGSISPKPRDETASSAAPKKVVRLYRARRRCGRSARRLIRRLPHRSREPSFAVTRGSFARQRRQLVPQLAGDLLVFLVEAFAIIGVFADPHLIAQAETDFVKPIGIGQRLERRGDDVAHAARQIVFRHFEVVNATGAHYRCLASGVAHRAAHRRGRRGVSPERPALGGNILRHALVAARAGIGINRVSDPGLLGVIELAAARQRNKIGAGPGKGCAEERRVLGRAAAADAFFGEKPNADGKLFAYRAAHFGEHFERQRRAN